MTEEKKENRKIIIDEDWKNQARKEKEVLKAKEEVEHEKPSGKDSERELPPADFTGLVSMLATQAFFALGLIRSKEDTDKESEPDWSMAKYNIDMLTTLDEKCKGNLSPQEQQMLKNTLDQLRMTFVGMSK